MSRPCVVVYCHRLPLLLPVVSLAFMCLSFPASRVSPPYGITRCSNDGLYLWLKKILFGVTARSRGSQALDGLTSTKRFAW